MPLTAQEPDLTGRSATPAPEPAGRSSAPIAPSDRPPAATPPSVSPQAVYDAYRRQIEHEDNLISGRSSWLLMAQSFFVVAYAILHQLAPPDPKLQPVTTLLIWAIAIVGWLACVPIGLAVLAGGRVMCELRAEFATRRRTWPALDELASNLPALQPTGPRLALGRSPSVILPVLFLSFWTVLLIASLVS